jgi:thiamine biosynthesis protein ThiI
VSHDYTCSIFELNVGVLPMEPDKVLVRYGEIGLKSPGVRRHFENLLHRHIKVFLQRKEISYSKIIRERGRFFIHTSQPQEAAEASARIFGVVSSSPVWTVTARLRKIVAFTGTLTPQLLDDGQTFAVRARRLKTHTFSSQDIAAQVGAEIIEAATTMKRSVQVDLDNPDVEIHVEVRQKFAYVFSQLIKGPGGLPYGSQGTVVGLHSGGLDSPVAQWLMMKRGAHVIPLYFDAASSTENGFVERAIKSAQILAEWIPEEELELLVIPYHEVLKRLQMSKHRKLICILCKRMMYRIGAMVAAQEKAQALVTGETLGQVASQTLTNLTILDSVITLPIFRPLIGMDKTETMTLARKIGTFQVSSQDVGECFAVPSQPSIAASLADVHEAESKIPIPEMVLEAINNIKRVALA